MRKNIVLMLVIILSALSAHAVKTPYVDKNCSPKLIRDNSTGSAAGSSPLIQVAKYLKEISFSSSPSDERIKNQFPEVSVLQGMRVLVVDDDIVITKLYARVLKSKGALVSTAANGLEAVDMVQKEERPFDLILMDKEMPEMDGNSATLVIRALGFNVAIISTSTCNDPESIKEIIDSGVDLHMGKVMAAELISQFVARAFSSRQQSSAKKDSKAIFKTSPIESRASTKLR